MIDEVRKAVKGLGCLGLNKMVKFYPFGNGKLHVLQQKGHMIKSVFYKDNSDK